MTTTNTAYLAFGIVLKEEDASYNDEFSDAVHASAALALEYFGDTNGCTRILCIKPSVRQTDWFPARLQQSDLAGDPIWVALLLDFCNRHNMGMEATPSWLLFHTSV
jgi:hypothetical protein